jgi:hypothetical protein
MADQTNALANGFQIELYPAIKDGGRESRREAFGDAPPLNISYSCSS